LEEFCYKLPKLSGNPAHTDDKDTSYIHIVHRKKYSSMWASNSKPCDHESDASFGIIMFVEVVRQDL